MKTEDRPVAELWDQTLMRETARTIQEAAKGDV